MRKLIALTLIAVLIAAFTPGLVFAAGYDEPTSGESPHAGWTTTSDQCKQCHAVHKAIGNRNLLRSSNSRYNDCAYCHLDGAGAAGYDVYTNNLYNGHTMGSIGVGGGVQTLAKTSVGAASQVIKARPSRFTADGRVIIPDHGNSTSNAEAITSARSYRGGSFAVSGSAAWVGYNTTQTVTAAAGQGLRPNGDTTFNCNGCHMAHANPEKVITWRFLSLNPNARTRNQTGLFTYYGPEWPSYQPLVGARQAVTDIRQVNTTSLTNKILVRNPNDYATSANLPYVYDETTARATGERRKALTAWCADCHNLNVMGPGQTGAGTAYYTTLKAWDGDNQQYSWYSHNTAYSPSANAKNSANAYAGGYSTAAGAIAPACYDCHVGYGNTDVNKDNPSAPANVPSPYSDLKSVTDNNTYDPFTDPGAVGVGQNYDDWPHTGSMESYALLKTIPNRMTPGDATGGDDGTITNAGTDASTYDAAGLDNVCRQCHAADVRDPKTIQFDNTETAGSVFTSVVPAPGP